MPALLATCLASGTPLPASTIHVTAPDIHPVSPPVRDGVPAALDAFLDWLYQLTTGQQSLGQRPWYLPEPPPEARPEASRYALSVEQSEFTLREGSSEPVAVPLSIVREGTDPQAIELRTEGSNDDTRDLVWSFDTALAMQTESGDGHSVIVPVTQSRAMLRVSLDVGMAPLLPHERRLTLHADNGREQQRVEITLAIEPVDAPDVYLLIGQSNMVGSSELGAKDATAGGADETHERIRQLNVLQNDRSLYPEPAHFSDEGHNARAPMFIVAEDPLHEPRHEALKYKPGTHVGLGLSFAKAALAYTSRSVYLVPAAWGATGFCDNGRGALAWNARDNAGPSLGGTLLVERALTRLNLTLRETGGILRGILWHQGGADANHVECARSHASNLQKLVARLRSEARADTRGEDARGPGADIPFIVATQSRGRDETSDFSNFSALKSDIDAVHRSIRELIGYSDWVNNDDLVPPAYPCGSGSCVHFGAAAYREMGHRFNDALQRIINAD